MQKISIAEAAEETGLSVAWWRQQILNKAFPFYKVGRRVLIDRADLEKLFQRSRIEPRVAAQGAAGGAE